MYEFNFNKPAPAKKIENCRMWFAVCSPIIAIFIEAFAATSFKLGILVWVSAVIALYASCIADKRYLAEEQGFDVSELSRLIIFPPLYVFKRCKLTRRSTTPAIVMTVLIFYALIFNGFTQAALMDDDDKLDYIRGSYVQNISGLDATGLATIEDSLENYAGDEELTWTESEKSGRITVVAENSRIKLTFTASFDGYYIGDISVSECIIDGKKYKDDELKEKLAEIFSESDDTSSDTSYDNSYENSSETESYTQA